MIQRRGNGLVNFNRSWDEYREGFGFPSSEFWLGNEKLSYITNQALYELRMDMTLSSGDSIYTIYKGIRIIDDFGDYKLTVIGAYESNIGENFVFFYFMERNIMK